MYNKKLYLAFISVFPKSDFPHSQNKGTKFVCFLLKSKNIKDQKKNKCCRKYLDICAAKYRFDLFIVWRTYSPKTLPVNGVIFYTAI